MIRLLISCVLSLAWVCSAQADNGAIAYAYPVSGITVDGDLSDWPDGLQRYPIQLNAQQEVTPGDENFSADFRAGYDVDSRSVYLGIEVTDQLHSTGDISDVSWSDQDGVIVYFDRNHEPQGSGAVLYSATGDQRQLLTSSGHWDADVEQAGWDNVTLEVKRHENTTTYEWRIKTAQPLKPGSSLGIDFLISDSDAVDHDEAAALYVWGPGFAKSQAGGRIGDLLLIDPKKNLGTLQGRLDWQAVAQQADSETSDTQPGQPRPQRVRIVASDNPDLWLHAAVDDNGKYAVTLPVGDYAISIPDKTFGDPWSDLQVVAPGKAVVASVSNGETVSAPLLHVATLAAPDILHSKGVLFDYTPEQAESVDSTILALMDYYQVPGVSVALVKDSQLVYHRALGLKNTYSAEPVTGETLFEAASITKIVFAFAVNRMAQRGEIDLDKPLYLYLPFEDIAHDERYKKITARHVLSHQSGFPNWRWFNEDGKLDIKFYPGIKYGYSGEGFEYLGRVIAKIADKPLETVLMEEVQRPMGLVENTYFSDTEALYPVASRGHIDGKAGPYGFPEQIGVAHSMYTEAETFSNFMINLIKQQGLSAEGYARMLEPQIEVPLEPEQRPQWPSRMGLGFHLMNSPYGLVFGHGGNNGDFQCIFEIYQDHKMGFIVFTNSNTGVALIDDLREYLITGKEQPESVAVGD